MIRKFFFIIINYFFDHIKFIFSNTKNVLGNINFSLNIILIKILFIFDLKIKF
jgi:hypothetical protein